MDILKIIEREASNVDVIYIYSVDNMYKSYGKSALIICSLIPEVKSCDETIVSLDVIMNTVCMDKQQIETLSQAYSIIRIDN